MHLSSTVLFLTVPPEGSAQTLLYFDRGWPFFEYSVAMLAKTQGTNQWASMIDVANKFGMATRGAPHTPAEFAEILKAKTFTNGADAELVVWLYTRTAVAVFGGATELKYRNCDWGDDEVEQLCKWLPMCKNVAHVNLGVNPRIGDRGLRALAQVLRGGGLPALKGLGVHKGAATQAGFDELEGACRARGGIVIELGK